MASKITVRFFQVQCAPNYTQSFADALREVHGLPDLEARTRTIGGVGIRLERFETRGGLIRAEIIKIQSDNLPAEVHPDGLTQLDAESLGYGTVFVYDERLSILAIQYDNRIISPNRIGAYLRAHGDNCAFRFLPIPSDQAWENFADGSIKKFKIRMAIPNDFDVSMGDEMGDSISMLSEAYQAPYVTIEMSVGHRKTTLADAVKDLAQRYVGGAEVVSMRAKTVENEGEIDLLDDLLKSTEEIEIPADPDASYRSRIGFVVTSFNEHREHLVNYGAD